ncbi:hypothetical protein DEV91_13232 [Phyllobacterium brassicacearum]|nr:hypothetical protein DEV91_13232 [Phyllobacterium brassicacearum]
MGVARPINHREHSMDLVIRVHGDADHVWTANDSM